MILSSCYCCISNLSYFSFWIWDSRWLIANPCSRSPMSLASFYNTRLAARELARLLISSLLMICWLMLCLARESRVPLARHSSSNTCWWRLHWCAYDWYLASWQSFSATRWSTVPYLTSDVHWGGDSCS